MGLKTTIAAGIASYIGVKLFNNRHQLKETYDIEKERFDSMKQDKENIKKQLSIISSELEKIRELGQDTEQKVRVFQKDMEPRLGIIKEKTDHIQAYTTKED